MKNESFYYKKNIQPTMIREKRNKDKIKTYYDNFIKKGSVDSNVHPWVATSWKRSKANKVHNDNFANLITLTPTEFEEKYEANKIAIDFIDELYENNKQYFYNNNINFFLLDEESFVLQNYYLPQFHDIFKSFKGSRISERDIGTSSISIAKEHSVPFLLFGAETWQISLHSGDSCSAPIIVNDKVKYIINFCSIDKEELPYDLVLSLLVTFKHSLEQYLNVAEKYISLNTLLNEIPLSVFCVKPSGNITYVNNSGKQRLDNNTNLKDVFLNYEHIPISLALKGVATHNKEIVWIGKTRTYEDITTVLPIKIGNEIESVIVGSYPVEEFKTILAHAAGYSSRYSLQSLVGKTQNFITMQNRATKIAKSDNNALLQGEPGTGKQRLAHGIHQASPRAANPLIVVKCGKVAESILADEIFGYGEKSTWVPGKIELANQGTLFIDEVEKLPIAIGDKLANILTKKKIKTQNAETPINIRLIAACDSNLKRLTEKNLFSKKLYNILSKVIIKIPSLQERADDISILSQHILSEMAAQHNLKPKHLSKEALNLLQNFKWTGNIKQLQEVLEMAFFHTPGTTIDTDKINLPKNTTIGKAWKHDADAFLEAWKAAGGNISRLSVMLGVSRVTLYRYLRKYNLITKKKTNK